MGFRPRPMRSHPHLLLWATAKIRRKAKIVPNDCLG